MNELQHKEKEIERKVCGFLILRFFGKIVTIYNFYGYYKMPMPLSHWLDYVLHFNLTVNAQLIRQKKMN